MQNSDMSINIKSELESPDLETESYNFYAEDGEGHSPEGEIDKIKFEKDLEDQEQANILANHLNAIKAEPHGSRKKDKEKKKEKTKREIEEEDREKMQ